MKHVKGLDVYTPGLDDFLKQHPWSGNPRLTADWSRFRNFEAGEAFKELYRELERNQHGLCAFCEIELTKTDHQIEHFHPKNPKVSAGAECDWMFRPDNLLAACKGGSVSYLNEPHTLQPIRENQSCGQFKKDKVLDEQLLKPSELPASSSLFRVDQQNGQMEVDTEHCDQAQIPVAKAQATIDLLNLDCRRLRNARRAVIEALEEEEQVLGLPEIEENEALQGYEAMARRHLLPGDEDTLQPFFTTRRSFFGGLAESVLQQPSQSWI